MIGFSEPEGWPGCELAWMLARRWWGQGYATEGARAALDYAFTAAGKARVISLIRPDNRASIGVAERLGESVIGRHEMNGREFLVYGIDRASCAGPASLPGAGRAALACGVSPDQLYCTCSRVFRNRMSGHSLPVVSRCQAFLARNTGRPSWSSARLP